MFERRFAKGECEIRAGKAGNPMIAGYAAVFNSRSQNLGGFVEQIEPRAFNRALKTADVRALGNHDPSWLLGRRTSGTLRLTTDTRGLDYEIDVNTADPDGQRALAKVERGDWDGSSFAFRVMPDGQEWDFDEAPAVRTLTNVDLIDVGPVTFPAYPDATSMARGAVQVLAETRGMDAGELAFALVNGDLRQMVLTTGDAPPLEEDPDEAEAQRQAAELEIFRAEIELLARMKGLPAPQQRGLSTAKFPVEFFTAINASSATFTTSTNGITLS